MADRGVVAPDFYSLLQTCARRESDSSLERAGLPATFLWFGIVSFGVKRCRRSAETKLASAEATRSLHSNVICISLQGEATPSLQPTAASFQSMATSFQPIGCVVSADGVRWPDFSIVAGFLTRGGVWLEGAGCSAGDGDGDGRWPTAGGRPSAIAIARGVFGTFILAADSMRDARAFGAPAPARAAPQAD